MSAEYDLWLLYHADGHPVAHIGDYNALQYAKVTNGVGSFALTLPSTFDISLVQRDTRLAVYRTPVGGAKALDFVGLVRYISKEVRGKSMSYTLGGPDLNDFLNRRIVAYAAGTAQASKSDFADDMMKEVVSESMGAGALAARRITGYGFSIQADLGAGTTVTKAFSWQNVLETLQKIADASQATLATAVYFGIVPLSDGWTCEFRTNVGQWGADRRYPSGPAGPIIFSLDFQNLADVTRNINYREEATHVYAGGQGTEAARNIQTDQDTVRSGASPFNRCELFRNATNSTTNAGVLAEATTAVRDGRPRRLFSANLVQSGYRLYGRDYEHGDYVTCVFDGETIDARIDGVSVNVNGNVETVTMLVREESTA